MNFSKAIESIKGWPWASLVLQAIYQVLLIATWQHRGASSWVLFAFILLVVAWAAVNVLGIFGLTITTQAPGRPSQNNPPKPPSTL